MGKPGTDGEIRLEALCIKNYKMRPMLHEGPVACFWIWAPRKYNDEQKLYQLPRVLPVLQNTHRWHGFKEGSQTITWQNIFKVTLWTKSFGISRYWKGVRMGIGSTYVLGKLKHMWNWNIVHITQLNQAFFNTFEKSQATKNHVWYPRTILGVQLTVELDST